MAPEVGTPVRGACVRPARMVGSRRRADRLRRVSLRLFDTATRELRDFTPRETGKVGMYICGLTTQGAPHIGHIRFAVAFDVLRRWLETGHGYDVTLVRNVTDIDDKVLRKAAEAGEEWFALDLPQRAPHVRGADALGVEPATYEPRATGHVPDMVDAHGDARREGPRVCRPRRQRRRVLRRALAGRSTAR